MFASWLIVLCVCHSNGMSIPMLAWLALIPFAIEDMGYAMDLGQIRRELERLKQKLR